MAATPVQAKPLKPWMGLLFILLFLQLPLYLLGIRSIVTDKFHSKSTSEALTRIPDDNARPLGISLVAMGMMMSVWTLGLFLHARGGRAPWRPILFLTLALQAAAVVLWFPPWKVPADGVESVFYASLLLLSAAAGAVCWTSRTGFYRKGPRGLASATVIALGIAQVAAWFWVDEYKRFGLLVAPLVVVTGGAQIALVWPGTLDSLAARIRGSSRPFWSLDPGTKERWSSGESPVLLLRCVVPDGVKVEKLGLHRILFWIDGQVKGTRTREPGSPEILGFSSKVVSPTQDMRVEFRSPQSWAELYGERLADGREHGVRLLFRCTWSDRSWNTSTIDLKFSAAER